MNKRKTRSDSKSRATARKHPLARRPHDVGNVGEVPDSAADDQTLGEGGADDDGQGAAREPPGKTPR